MLTDLFLPKLQDLAAQQSPTMLELLERKRRSDSVETATDPEYLRGAFAVIAEHYISAIDQGYLKFADDYERNEFMWLLQLLVDYATDGKMEDLFPPQPIQNHQRPLLRTVKNQTSDNRKITGKTPA